MTVHAPLSMSKEAFFAWIEQREERYEYARGRVIMMVRITRNHAQATGNLVSVLKQRLSPERYDVATDGFAVDIGESFRVPDVVVEPAQTDGKALEAKAPILIVEVLSPGTLHVDFGDKRQEYLSLPTLDTYLIVSPDEPRAWIWQRTDGVFPSEPEMIEGLDKQIVLPALGAQIALSEIYRGIV
ncbi:MAG: Uma2 family endonuclease [Rhizobiales bacterium]|nr:Uma2 family endonuclease [Hyphomicrobiales bacterium]